MSSWKKSLGRAPMRWMAALFLFAAAGAGVGYLGYRHKMEEKREAEVLKFLESANAKLKAQIASRKAESRPVASAVQTESLHPQATPSAPSRPGATFESYPTDAQKRLVMHPRLGKVIEIRYANGGVLYKPNLKRYDVATGRFLPEEFPPDSDAPKVQDN